MALFNNQPQLVPSMRGLPLNQNLKKISPDGTIEFHDDKDILFQGLGGGYRDPNDPAPGQEGMNFGNYGNEFFNSNQGLTLAMLLGQLGAGMALPGSAQAGVGNVASAFFQNQLFNRLLTSSLGGGQNPFVSGSATLGSGVAGLTPEQQSAILSASQNQSQIPFQNFLRYAQGVSALRPDAATTPNLQRIESDFPPGKDGKPNPQGEVDPRKKYVYSLDPKTGDIGKYITTKSSPEPKGSSTANLLGLSDVEKLLAQEFFSDVEGKLRKEDIGAARGILQDLSDTQTGNPVSARLLFYLPDNQRREWIEAMREFAPLAKSPGAINILADRLEEKYFPGGSSTGLQTPKSSEEARAIKPGVKYLNPNGIVVENYIDKDGNIKIRKAE